MSKGATLEVMLEGLRAQWQTLTEPDFKFNDNGQYGIGVALDEASASKLNKAIRYVENESGEVGRAYAAGEVLKATMTAERRDKKTGKREALTPLVYTPDAQPASAEDKAQITRNAKYNLQVLVRDYPPVGKQIEEVGGDGQPTGRMVWPTGCRAGGVSVKFKAVQIASYDAGLPTAAEAGFTPVQQDDTTNEGF